MDSPSGLKEQWQQRQKQLGNTSRAVLFKNFPAGFNDRLHRQHVKFIRENIPAGAASLLDVGCGYGRTAMPLKQAFPGMRFSGVELCEEFALAFEKNIGPCFNGSIVEFQPQDSYDVITIITLLMYLDEGQRTRELNKLYASLNDGGRLVIIEPYLNILTLFRRKFRISTFSPTGGDVKYFRRRELENLARSVMPGCNIVRSRYFNMPFLGFPRLHAGIVVEKH